MTDLFEPYVLWDSNERAEVRSLQELDRIIDQLTVKAKEEMPFSVQLAANTETSLLITVGDEESHMEFYSAKGNPLVVGCRGPWDDDRLVAFTHGEEYSEMERRYFVPIFDAREALRQYYLTGRRPDNIRWNDDSV